MEEEEDNPPKQVCYEVGLGLYMWENFPPKRNLFMYQRNRLLRERGRWLEMGTRLMKYYR